MGSDGYEGVGDMLASRQGWHTDRVLRRYTHPKSIADYTSVRSCFEVSLRRSIGGLKHGFISSAALFELAVGVSKRVYWARCGETVTFVHPAHKRKAGLLRKQYLKKTLLQCRLGGLI